MGREVEIGDGVQIENDVFEIVDISDRIYLANGHKIINHERNWALSNDPSTKLTFVKNPLVGNTKIDRYTLADLDDVQLSLVCQINEYAQRLCSEDSLWINRIVRTFGPEALDEKLLGMTFREYYFHKKLIKFEDII